MPKSAKNHFAGPRDLALATPTRSLFSSKSQNGRIAVIGGSSDFHGAPALASLSANQTLGALRVGVGYAITYVPKSVLHDVRAVSPNLIVKSLLGNDLSTSDLSFLRKELSKADSVVIGPGLGRKKGSIAAVSRLSKSLIGSDKRVVIDADAILGVSKIRLSKNFSITPNQKEFSLFYKREIGNDLRKRAYAAIVVAKKISATIVLKGHETIVTDGGRIKIIKSKSAALATMGTGDVLSGLIGAYAALNSDMFISSVAGAYIHSLIGDMLNLRMGRHILATDIIAEIPNAIKKFDKNDK
ncbi:MAG: NAD(P)H-hydrate dehydratase [Candidatus Micrarchaeota archaeon]|nr:NAD(P)H-hydrate dehydratase [Candidatus Micrarchaeota archaeon]